MKINFNAFLMLIVVAICACNGQNNAQMDENHKYTNDLINETSPYLLQHAHNPVNWQAWNDETLKQAKEEDKLLLISIGYAACHWCHVMEHESFEDSTVAAIMNENFICVKVDREERPDVDQIYMDACQMLTGSGGWPLNAIALPDGRPIFAGTYFPQENWMKVLDYFGSYYPENKEEALKQAEQVTEGIQSNEMIDFNTNPAQFSQEDLDMAWSNWTPRIDFKRGGKTGAPKFPMPNNWEYLLRQYYYTQDENQLKAVTATLDNMMMGGIYDQVGGGFARYSTDGVWKVPHFEKMMYDNGQLVSLYSMAYSATGNEDYKVVVEETLDWVKREMTHSSNGFYSSLDADSEGEEGKFYIFTKDEFEGIVSDNADVLGKFWNVKEEGNWEESNILHMSQDVTTFCEKEELDETWFRSILKDAKQDVLEAREQRIRPGLDDKILTSWNALMLKGYVDAYKAFGKPEYLTAAIENGNFIREEMLQSDNRLDRNFKNGFSTINGFLDDYSFTIEAFLALYEVTFNEDWLFQAQDLADYVIDHFYDESSAMFYYTSDIDKALIARKMESSDNVIPASNSAMAKGLYLLSKYLYNEDYRLKSSQMVNNMSQYVLEYGPFYSNWAMVMDMMIHPPYEVAIVGKEANAKRATLQQNFIPNAIYLGGEDEGTLELLEGKLQEGDTYIYVCQDRVCKMPVTDPSQALTLLKE